MRTALAPSHAGSEGLASFSWTDLAAAGIVLVILVGLGIALLRFVQWRRRQD